MLKKNKLQEELEFEKRKQFLITYNTDFDQWMSALNFKSIRSNTPADYHYSHYNEFVQALYGVEVFRNEFLNIDVRFIRDFYEHKFMIVGILGGHSEVYSMEKFKSLILEGVNKSLTEIKENLAKYENTPG